jgi:protein-tyrosine phosphatase
MGLFSNLFSRRKQLDPLDLSLLGADMHSHLIPGIDDGSKTMDESVEMISRLANLGYKKIITTPHVMSDFYRNSSERILLGLDALTKELAERKIHVGIEAAAEYYCDEHFEKLVEEDDILTFGDNYVLFELAFAQEPSNLNRVLFNLQMAGYKPVLAHPERYMYYHGNYSKYKDFVDKDILLQVNLNSLGGAYGPPTKKIGERLLDDGLVSFVGSDCHHSGHIDLMEQSTRNPSLHAAVESGHLKNNQL